MSSYRNGYGGWHHEMSVHLHHTHVSWTEIWYDTISLTSSSLCDFRLTELEVRSQSLTFENQESCSGFMLVKIWHECLDLSSYGTWVNSHEQQSESSKSWILLILIIKGGPFFGVFVPISWECTKSIESQIVDLNYPIIGFGLSDLKARTQIPEHSSE